MNLQLIKTVEISMYNFENREHAPDRIEPYAVVWTKHSDKSATIVQCWYSDPMTFGNGDSKIGQSIETYELPSLKKSLEFLNSVL